MVINLNINIIWFHVFADIIVHETSALLFDYLIKRPRIKVSIYDVTAEQLLIKSNPTRNAVVNYEPSNIDFIQPIISNHCTLTGTRYDLSIRSSYAEENKNSSIAVMSNVIGMMNIWLSMRIFSTFNVTMKLYFSNWSIFWWRTNKELVPAATVGILFAGRSFDQSTTSTIQIWTNEIVCNAIDTNATIHWRYSISGRARNGSRHRSFQIMEWIIHIIFIAFLRYPATLSVTIQNCVPDMNRSKSFSRPLSVLEEELTRDIYSEECDRLLGASVSTEVMNDTEGNGNANNKTSALQQQNKTKKRNWVRHVWVSFNLFKISLIEFMCIVNRSVPNCNLVWSTNTNQVHNIASIHHPAQPVALSASSVPMASCWPSIVPPRSIMITK